MKNNVEKQWNSIANIYSSKGVDYSQFPYYILNRFKNVSFLEAGSGDGEVTIFMAKNENDSVGLEIADCFIKIATRKIDKIDFENIKFVKGDVRHMPFKDNTFDIIFSGGVVEHFEETYEALSEHVKILKNGGQILIGVPCKQGLHYPLKLVMQFLGIWNIGFEKSFAKKEFRAKLCENNLEIKEEFLFPLRASSNQTRIRYIVTAIFSTVDKLIYGTHMMYFLCKKVN